MSRSADRALCAALAFAPLTVSACYGPTGTYLKEAPLVVATADAVHVADRFEVALEGMQLVVRTTPLCAASSVGEYTIVREDRALKKTPRKHNLIMAGVGAALTTLGALVIAPPLESTPRFMIGFPSLLVGVPMLAINPFVAMFPDVRRKTHAPDRYRAVTLANPNDWKVCGEPTAAVASVKVEAKGGSETVSLDLAGSGTVELPADLRAWSSACDVDISLDVTVAAVYGETRTTKSSILSARAEQANINGEGDEHAPDAIRTRLSLDDIHIELGEQAGRLEPQPYLETERWSFKLARPSSKVTPPASGGTRAADLARACKARRQAQEDKARAEARARCIAPLRAGVEAECRPTCTDTKKQLRCSVEHEVCLDKTAGIGGTLRERCDSDHYGCLLVIGQDSGSIERCTQTCATKVYDAKCPL